MNTQKTSRPRRVAWSLAGALAAFLLLALLVAGNALATSAGAGALNPPPAAASHWHTGAERLGALQAGPAAAHSSALTWHIEYVDAPSRFRDMTDRSLRLDAAGHPHIAYGADHLYYAWHDGTAWHIQMVDSAPLVGRYASLALDGAGHPHISYYDEANNNLKYAFFDGSIWHIQTVDTTGDVGQYTSLALDAASRPHISYYDSANGDLKYARWTGSAWHIQTVDSAGDVGSHTSLALDASGHPHISYYDETNDDLKYAWGEEVTLRFIYLPLVLRNC